MIEFYDNNNDPITLYFNEKLEGLYSNHATLRLLKKNTRKSTRNLRSSAGCADQFKLETSLTQKLYTGFELGLFPGFDTETEEEAGLLRNQAKMMML